MYYQRYNKIPNYTYTLYPSLKSLVADELVNKLVIKKKIKSEDRRFCKSPVAKSDKTIISLIFLNPIITLVGTRDYKAFKITSFCNRPVPRSRFAAPESK